MENIKIGLEINSNTDKETTKAKALNEQLKEAAGNAKKIRVDTGGKASSEAAAPTSYKAAKQVATGGAMSQAAPTGSREIMEYGALRGAAGATGSSARDFANEAQGLSGLVRLYAVYAANLYAVGAAFTALSKAMDTTNMIRGLDQIGAASGTALGALSKELVKATGGAISLREAMQATVKVTAAGLGSDTVLRLGQVATKASQALGVDMTDAISRLSRGVTKLEPELLDELGIFTKIDPAVQKYAVTLGKTANQLTDFERRQAFAIAVIEEGEKKFAAIKLDANPYNKLAASLADLTYKGLAFVNTFLTPVIDLLSTSPTALAVGMAALAGLILKQAIPAFGLFRENVRKASEEATAIAQTRAAQAISVQADLNTRLKQLAESRADTELKNFEAAEKSFKAYTQNIQRATGEGSRAVNRILKAETAFAITEEDITKTQQQAQKIRAQGVKENNQALIGLADQYDNIAARARAWKSTEQEASAAVGKSNEQYQKDISNKRSIIGLNLQLAESLEKSSFKSQLVANAAYNGSLIGITNAIRLMNLQLKDSDIELNKLEKATLLARGATVAFFGAISSVIGSLTGLIGNIAALGGIVSFLVPFLTNTAKESKATNDAFNQLEESTKNLNKTFDLLAQKTLFSEQFSAESITARANALDSFSNAIGKTSRAAEKELTQMNWFDVGVNVVKSLWSGDVQAKLNKEVAYGLSQIFNDPQLFGSQQGTEAAKAIANLLKIDPEDLTSLQLVEKAFDRIGESDSPETIKKINSEIIKLGNVSKESSQNLNGINEAFKKLKESRDKFIAELLPSDSLSQYGRAVVDVSLSLEAALRNPVDRLEAIKRLFSELGKLGINDSSILSGVQAANDLADQLQTVQGELNATVLDIASLEASQKVVSEKIGDRESKLQKAFDQYREIGILKAKGLLDLVGISFEQAEKAAKFAEKGILTGLKEEVDEIALSLSNLRNFKETKLSVKLELDAKLAEIEEKVEEARLDVFVRGSEIFTNKLNQEFAKATATINNVFSGLLAGTEIGLKLRAESEKQLLDAQRADILAKYEAISSQDKLGLDLKKLALATKELQLSNMRIQGNLLDADPLVTEIAKLKTEIKGLDEVLSPKAGRKRSSREELTERYRQEQAQIRRGELMESERTVTADTLRLTEQLAATEAALANIAASRYAIELKLQSDVLQLANQNALRDKSQQIDVLKAKRTQIIANSEINSQLNEAALLERQALDEQINREESLYKQLEFQSLIAAKTLIINEAQKRGRKDIVEGTKQELDLLTRRENLRLQAEGQNIEAEQIKRQIELINLRSRVELDALTKNSQIEKQRLENRAQQLAIEERLFQVIQSNTQLPPEILAVNQNIVQTKRAQLDLETKLSDAERERQQAIIDINRRRQALLTSENVEDPRLLSANAVAALKLIDIEAQNVDRTYKSRINSARELNAATVYELELTKQLTEEKNRLARQEQERQRLLELRRQELDIEEKSFEVLSKSVPISAQYAADQQKNFAIRRAQLEFEDKAAQIAKQRQETLNGLALQEQEIRRTKTISVPGEAPELTQEGAGEVARINELRDAEIARSQAQLLGATAQLNANIGLAQQTAALNVEQDRYNKLLERSGTITDSLKTIFDGISDSLSNLVQNIGAFGEAFAKSIQSSEQNAKAVDTWTSKVEKLREAEKAASDPEEAAAATAARIGAEKELGKATAKQTKDELANSTKLIGATKNLFNEKSRAYKILAGVEKAMHVAKLAMMIKEMFFDTANTATAIGNSAARGTASVAEAGIKGVKAVVNALSDLPFPASLAAGAVMAATVGSVLSSIGGKAPTITGSSGITAERRQETQGTAMGFNEAGQEVQVRRGVFGDTEAKSQSIANSLEIIKETSVLGLENDNKVVKALEKLNRTLETSAKELYSIRGLRTGSATGAVEGTIGGGGFFSSKKINTAIIDSGIKVEGTFLALAKAAGGVISGFETIQTTTTRRKLFSKSTEIKIDTSEFELEDRAQASIRKVFSFGFDLISTLGEQSGILQSTIENQLANVDVKELISLRGLKGEELQKELASVTSAILDDAAFAVFSSFEKFAQFNEGMLQTVIRVTDTNTKVEAALENLTGTAQTLSFELSETIAQNFGGVKEFTESINQFTEQFLTDAERLEIQRGGLQRELDKLGFGYVKTKDDFKLAIQSLIASGQAGSELFASMMALQDSILAVDSASKQAIETNNKIIEANKNIQQALQGLTTDVLSLSTGYTEALAKNFGSAQEFINSIQQFTNRFLTDSERLKIQRGSLQRELERLGYGFVKTKDDFRLAIQGLINSGQASSTLFSSMLKLQDAMIAVNDATEKTTANLQSAYDSRVKELQGARDEFKKFADSLRDYRQGLLTGSQSPLTPAQQYLQSQLEFERVRGLAQAGDKDAIQKLQSVASAFLQASQKMYASSAQYVKDFEDVVQAVDTTTSYADMQVSTADQTLEALKQQFSTLVNISTSSQQTVIELQGLGTKLTEALAKYTESLGTTFSDFTVVDTIKTDVTTPTVVTNTDQQALNEAINASLQSYRQQLADIAAEELAAQKARLEYENQARIAAETAARLAKEAADRMAAAARLEYDWSLISGAAQGMAFDTNSVRKFARGGVINGTTPFAYTGGLGIMGEAGPEAIMPLRRTPSGDLGVIATNNENMSQQLAELTRQVQQLTQVVADGAVLNAAATDRNTEKVSQAVTDSAKTANYQTKLTDRTRVV